MKILITDKVDPLLLKLLNYHQIDYKENLHDNEEALLKVIGQFQGIVIRNRLKINSCFLNKATNLKFVARYGSGMECVDVKHAKKLNIYCFNSGEGNCDSVGEHALGMLLSLFHNINKSINEVKNLIWNREENKGLELKNKTVGIIGYGNTGEAFAKKLKGFNCEILAYDKYKSISKDENIIISDIDSIYNNADIVSIHVPFNPETKHLINTKFIERMKNPFYLINTSRGAVVSNNDLILGLKQQKILGACLDVIENENSQFNKIDINNNFNYLLNCSNVLITPHIAGLSKESNKRLSEVLINKILKLK